MAIGDTVVVLNHFPAELKARTRGKEAKQRYTLEIQAEPLVHNFSEDALGAGPAEAIRKVLSDQISAIAASASEATQLQRKYAATAYAGSKPWATKRYAGGKTGPKPPNQSDRLFNDSGRLAQGIFVRQNPTEKAFTINVPANRLDPRTFKSEAQLGEMVERLKTHMPALSNPRSLLDSQPVAEALMKGIRETMIRKGRMGEQNYDRLIAQTVQSVQGLLRQIAELGDIVT